MPMEFRPPQTPFSGRKTGFTSERYRHINVMIPLLKQMYHLGEDANIMMSYAIYHNIFMTIKMKIF